MDNKYCEGCKEFYKVHETGYWKSWCKLFKIWLVPDGEESLRIKDCIELEGKK